MINDFMYNIDRYINLCIINMCGMLNVVLCVYTLKVQTVKMNASMAEYGSSL